MFVHHVNPHLSDTAWNFTKNNEAGCDYSMQNILKSQRKIGMSSGLTCNLNDMQLAKFRTQICQQKYMQGVCYSEERCPFSHCLSWHRRNPMHMGYRPALCPNVMFCIGPNKKMRVKNHCQRGRLCLFSHTKEEQMYHPLVYKSQLCRDWPQCTKHFCPFAHGNEELRSVQTVNFPIAQGPEKLEVAMMLHQAFVKESITRPHHHSFLNNLQTRFTERKTDTPLYAPPTYSYYPHYQLNTHHPQPEFSSHLFGRSSTFPSTATASQEQSYPKVYWKVPYICGETEFNLANGHTNEPSTTYLTGTPLPLDRHPSQCIVEGNQVLEDKDSSHKMQHFALSTGESSNDMSWNDPNVYPFIHSPSTNGCATCSSFCVCHRIINVDQFGSTGLAKDDHAEEQRLINTLMVMFQRWLTTSNSSPSSRMTSKVESHSCSTPQSNNQDDQYVHSQNILDTPRNCEDFLLTRITDSFVHTCNHNSAMCSPIMDTRKCLSSANTSPMNDVACCGVSGDGPSTICRVTDDTRYASPSTQHTEAPTPVHPSHNSPTDLQYSTSAQWDFIHNVFSNISYDPVSPEVFPKEHHDSELHGAAHLHPFHTAMAPQHCSYSNNRIVSHDAVMTSQLFP